MEESSGPLVHLPNRAPLAGAHLLSHTQKGPSGPLLVFYFLRPRYRAAINEIRQHLFASRPKKRKDGGGEGRSQRHARFVRWGAILRSNRGHKLFLALRCSQEESTKGVQQGVLKAGSREIRGGGRSLSSLEISSWIQSMESIAYFGLEPEDKRGCCG